MSNARDKANIPALNFSSTGIDDNATSTAITISSLGLVGIGTTSPNHKFELLGGSPSVSIKSDNTTNGSSNIIFGDTDDDDIGKIFYEHGTNSFRFLTNASERMRINSSGNVGIGTTSPASLLHISGTSPQMSFTETDQSDKQYRIGSFGSAYAVYDVQQGQYRYILDTNGNHIFNEGSQDCDFRVESNNQANMLFVDGGNDRIGVGTSSPQAKLSIAGAGGSLSGASSLSFYDTNSASSRRWSISNGAGGNETSSIGQLFFSVGEGSVTADPMAGTAVMVLTKSARVGIGTSSPSSLLHIYSSSPQMIIQDGGTHGTNSTPGLIFKDSSSSQGEIGFENSGEMFIRQLKNADMTFRTNNSERMRINTSGQITVGGATADGKFAIASNAGSLSRLISLKDTGNAGGGRDYIEFFNNSGGSAGSIEHNGTSTVAYITSSDYRLKENVSYDFDATTRLKQLKPARFNFIGETDRTVDGFLAHEVSDIVPEAISGEKDALQVWKEGEELPEGVSVGDNKLDENGNTIMQIQGIDQSKLVPLLVKTIQELEARITALETNQP